ncbi:hypothetical protein G9A89_016947 [Geosiphon pyriformis]|nr:hypothetical protein G9A89_016947 [Geosiphon pyriformis]
MASKIATSFTVIVVLLALFYCDVLLYLEIIGVFRNVESYDGRGNCQIVPGPEACEDLVIHHRSGYAFAACGSLEDRLSQWWPPIANFRNSSYEPRENPWVYNIKTNEAFPLILKNFPETVDVSLLGLNFYDNPADPDKIFLFLINYRRTGNVIEVFEHRIATHEIFYLRTISHELIRTPNNIFPVSPDEFFITNDHYFKAGLKRKFEHFTRRPWGNIVFHSSSKNVTRIATEKIAYPNGISGNWNASRVYVSSIGDGELIIYERNSDNQLIEFERVFVGMPIDNHGIDEETGEIYVAGVPKPLRNHLYYSDPTGNSPKAPFTILKISNNTAKDLFFEKKYLVTKVLEDDGEIFHFVTTPAVDRGRNALLLSSIFMKGIIRCKLA